MKTDTALQYWGIERAQADGTSKRGLTEADLFDFPMTLRARTNAMRHAPALARQGFAVTARDAAPEGIAKIARVLKPGGTCPGTMLSARLVPIERAKTAKSWISPNNRISEGTNDEPHVFSAFKGLCRHDGEHEMPGSGHWHLVQQQP